MQLVQNHATFNEIRVYLLLKQLPPQAKIKKWYSACEINHSTLNSISYKSVDNRCVKKFEY